MNSSIKDPCQKHTQHTHSKTPNIGVFTAQIEDGDFILQLPKFFFHGWNVTFINIKAKATPTISVKTIDSPLGKELMDGKNNITKVHR